MRTRKRENALLCANAEERVSFGAWILSLERLSADVLGCGEILNLT